MIRIGRITGFIIFLFIIFPFILSAQTDEAEMREWIDASSYRDMSIVIPEGASPLLQHSAEIFKKYWENCTHRPITISTLNQGIINIWLGAELCTREWIAPEELEELGDEGFIIRTYTPTRKYAQKGVAKQLLICGKTDIGTLHGVYAFFERYLNVAWLSSSYIHKPPLGYRLKEMDYKFSPHFEYRVFLSDLPEFKMEGDRKEGLHLSLSIQEDDFIPIPIYKCFNTKPHTQNTVELETKVSQPPHPICFLSEETKHSFINFMQKQIELHPQRKLWTIATGNIEINSCPCKNCQEEVKTTDSPVTPLLKMLNNVVETLENLYPEKDLRFCLSLKNGMRKAPHKIQIHNKIFIALSTDTCDVAHAIDDPTSTTNSCFINDLKSWRSLSSNLLIQYYVGANYYCGLFSQPELFNFQKNIQTFDRYQVRGIIICTPSQQVFPLTEFGALKSYLLARLMWDPDLILEEEMNRFLNLYYGPVGSRYAEFFNYQKDFVKKNNVRCGIYQKVPWWNTDYASYAEKILQQTINMTFFSEDIYTHVLQDSIPLHYSALICPPDIQIQGDRFSETCPAIIQEEEFWKSIDKIEKSLSQKGSILSYREVIPDLICLKQFPTYPSLFQIYALENGYYTLWILPENKGNIIRLRNKASGIEYLSAFQKGLNPYLLWNEYQDVSNTGCGIPFSGECIVKEAENNKITIERELKKGVLVQRKTTLGDNGSIILEYTCENRNPQEENISFYIIPRFSLNEDDKTIELWSNSNQKWERLKQIAIAYQPFTYDFENIHKDKITGIGIYYCDKGEFLKLELQQLPPEHIEFLFSYSYYDGYIAPIMKFHTTISSQQAYSFSLHCQIQKQSPTL